MLDHELGLLKRPAEREAGNTAKPFATDVERVPLLETDGSICVSKRNNVQTGNDGRRVVPSTHEI